MSKIAALKSAIDTEFADILGRDFPAFSEAEMARRVKLAEELIARREVDGLIVAEALRAGTATGWFTGWPVTAEAVTLIAPGLPRRLHVQHYNHLPLARKLAHETEVEWGGRSGLMAAADRLKEARPNARRIGLIGRIGAGQYQALADKFEVVDMNGEYTALRLVKSPEELRWLRLGALMTDLGITGLAEGARPGLTERDLGPLVEAPFLPYGATSYLHYFLTTAMAAPDVGVPRQFSSGHVLAKGDVIATEISADYWGYTGQVLRTFFIGEEPNSLYKELHAVADAAFDAVVAKVRPGTHARELVESSALIEEAGFTIIDDLVHGYGGGYLPPVLGCASRPAANALPDVTLEAGMALVIQPNITTKDGTAGVQTGHLVMVTEDGAQALHDFPRGYQVI